MTTSVTASTQRKEEKKNSSRISKHVNFTLCGSCFWSASYMDSRGIEKCPVCQSDKIEVIPVAGNEMYVYDYDSQRGVTVDFLPLKVSA